MISDSSSALPASDYSRLNSENTSGDGDQLLSSQTSCRDSSASSIVTYRVYPTRWFILLIVFCINFLNAAMWISFAPVAYLSATYFEITLFKVNLLAAVFFALFIPFSFVGEWLMESFGLRSLIVLSTLMNFIAAALRIGACYLATGTSIQYGVLLGGQSIAGVAQAFILIQPTKLSAFWFAPSERAVANTLGSMSNQLGMMTAMLVTPFIVDGQSENIKLVMFVWGLPNILPLFMCLIFLKVGSSPPSPASPASTSASMDFRHSLKSVFRSRSFILLSITFGGGMAVFSCLIALVSQILCPNGYSDDFSGIVATSFVASGFVGAFVIGSIADRTRAYETVFRACYPIAALGMIWFSIFSNYPESEWLIVAGCCWTGFFGLVLLPISLELGVECTYPVSEATSSGLIILAGQLLGALLLAGLPLFGTPLTAKQEAIEKCDTSTVQALDMWVGTEALAVVTALCAVTSTLFFRSPNKRIQAETSRLNLDLPIG